MEGVSSHSCNFQSNSNLKILYFNARSLLPKFDELLLLTDFHHPDVICITESWLCLDILDSEISIPGFQTMRLDRNRHGGGVLMYVSDKYIVKRLPSHASLELLTVTLHCGNYRSCLSLFYRPPGSPADILYSLHSYLVNKHSSVL